MKRRLLIGGALVAGAMGALAWRRIKGSPPEVGFALSEDELAAARALMAESPVIDAHAHPGRTFVRGAENLNWKLRLYALMGTFEERTVSDMREGGLWASVFNGVADFQLLALTDQGLEATRDFTPGEAWASYQRQIANLRALGDQGLVQLCLTPDDVMAAHAAGKPGAILAMEGADFLENDAGRVQQIVADGVRMVTLVHYHDNSLGRIMTGAENDKGLTAFGREVVAEANRAGLMLDASHASEKTAFEMVDLSTKPVVLTHTHINDPATITHPRFVSRELAQAVAESGGYVGAWPAGIGMTTLAEFVDRIEWLIDAMGPDHVALGSDMDANYKPVLETYRKMPLVIGALLARGHAPEVVRKLAGENFLRVWRQTQAS